MEGQNRIKNLDHAEWLLRVSTAKLANRLSLKTDRSDLIEFSFGDRTMALWYSDAKVICTNADDTTGGIIALGIQRSIRSLLPPEKKKKVKTETKKELRKRMEKLQKEVEEIKAKVPPCANHGLPVLEDLVEAVIVWAKEKGILGKATPMAQGLKTLEEVTELLNAIRLEDKPEISDAIGDIMVTIIIQAEMQGMDIQACLQGAYDIISKRKGSMVNGVFVKSV
jgi:NTP pyrophosphatase (non-canonical NTP hydrolase)